MKRKTTSQIRKEHHRKQGMRQTLLKDNKGSAIVMVLVAIAFVSVIGSMIMYSSFYNYRMKVTDRKAKDNFYSAEQAMDEIRTGLKQIASEAFAFAYRETLQKYGEENREDRTKTFETYYEKELRKRLQTLTDSRKYDLLVLRGFLSDPAPQKGEQGAYVDSSKENALLLYTDGICMEDVRVTYTDEQGYVSIIETDFLFAMPDLELGDTYEFPSVGEYCLIAEKELVIERAQTGMEKTVMTGSVYGGKEGVTIEPLGTLQVQNKKVGEEQDRTVKFITDGEILLGEDDTQAASFLETSKQVSLWTSGIRLKGVKTELGSRKHLSLRGDTYVQDDLTIESAGAKVELAGTYTGFGNMTTEAKNSSSILVNGYEASLDLSGLTSLSLGGNAYIGTSKLDTSAVEEAEGKNEDIKMGNAVAAKIEQIAYLVPAECIGYDVSAGTSVVAKNPVNAKDPSYVSFLEKRKQDPERYKEVNLNRIDAVVGKPLSNYGASYEKVYFKPDQETVWVYYYLKFASVREASQFFKDYYNASKEELDQYLGNYVKSLDIGALSAQQMYLVGNMLTRTESGETTLVSETAGEDTDKQILWNQKYAEYSNQFMSLCKKLTDNYANLTLKERRAGVYENLIRTELIAQYKKNGIFNREYVVFQNETADTYALLILEGDGNAVDIKQAILDAGIASEDVGKVGLIVSERPLTTEAGFSFEGTIITRESLRVGKSSASFTIIDNMDDVMLGTYSYRYDGENRKLEALSLFRDGKGSEILETEDDEETEITADKLVVYKNWTKK